LRPAFGGRHLRRVISELGKVCREGVLHDAGYACASVGGKHS
jgi:hypothetical protein